MTDQSAHQPIEKQVEEIFPCTMDCSNEEKYGNPHIHFPDCAAKYRPAVLALLTNEIKAAEEAAAKEFFTKFVDYFEADIDSRPAIDFKNFRGALARHDKALLERRENEHAAELEIKRKSFEAVAASEFDLRRRVVDLERREERRLKLAKSWRNLAGKPEDWITEGDPTTTAILAAGRATMIKCAEELEAL